MQAEAHQDEWETSHLMTLQHFISAFYDLLSLMTRFL